MPKQKIVIEEPEIPSFKVDFSGEDIEQEIYDFCESFEITVPPIERFEEIMDLDAFVKNIYVFTDIAKVAKSQEHAYEMIMNYFDAFIKLCFTKRPSPREKPSGNDHAIKPNFVEKVVPACFKLKNDEYKYFRIIIKRSGIKGAGMGAFALEPIPKGAICQYKGLAKSLKSMNAFYSWEVQKYNLNGKAKEYGEPIHYLDATSLEHSNWTRYVNCGLRAVNNNTAVLQIYDKIFYITTRNIHQGEELFIDYGEGYRTDNLGIDDRKY